MIKRAEQHLEKYKNVTLICGDFPASDFDAEFDVIYSSLTWMHFRDKQAVMNKTAGLLKNYGRFVLSVSKDQADTIEYGSRKIRIFPDGFNEIRAQIENSGLHLLQTVETENAYIFVSEKR